MRFYSTCSRVLSIWVAALLLGALSFGLGCRPENSETQTLRLATTTSTRDSGLIDQLVPPFEQQNNIRVDVLATGTGKAIKLGEMGDVDLLLVHARTAEDAFMDAGHGVRREDVMYNSFELLGPSADPASVKGLEVIAALKKIVEQGARFISRGDDSGTHKREKLLWKSAELEPNWPEYRESGQGMGATLTIADELSAYVLTDRGTYLNFRDKIDLVPLAVQTTDMRNPYGVLVVNPTKNPSVRANLADRFVDYVISPTAQQLIADYRIAGEQLFVPLHLPVAQE